ncbi:MAG: hypothetical protein J6W07_06085, partial [Bacteroidales bacterium]|nr:hypothetical protein [Bacteroidales bacterium]
MRRLAVILFLLLSWPAMAQEMRFVNYGAANGLPSNSVYALAQDAHGALWLGTRNGLCRFDGTKFETWKEFGRVNALAMDKDDRVWMGTTDGICVKVKDAFIQGHRGLIRALTTDSDGNVWATVGDTLLLKLTYKNGIEELARCSYDKRDHEGDYPYFQIYEARDGKLWLAGRLVRMQYVADRTHPEIIHPFGDSGFCPGSLAEAGGQFFVFDDHTSILYTYQEGTLTPKGRLPISHARLLTDSGGRLWAAGSYGLALVNTDKPEETKVCKTTSAELYCIFEDRQGNL